MGISMAEVNRLQKGITMAEVNRLQTGITMAEVDKIMGDSSAEITMNIYNKAQEGDNENT